MFPLLIFKRTNTNVDANFKRDRLIWLLTSVFFLLLFGRNAFKKPVLAAALIIYLPFIFASFRQSLDLLAKSYSLVALWVLFAASYFWSVVPKVSLDNILTQSAFMILALFITLNHKVDGFAKSLRFAFILILGVVVLYCLAFPGSSFSAAGMVAFYPHKNGLGAMMALGALVLFFTPDRTKWHIVLGFLAIGFLIASQSKTSIFLVAICSMLIPIANWWVRNFYMESQQLSVQKILRFILFVLIIVGLISIVVFRDALLDMLWDNMTKTLFTGRGALWLTVIQQMRANSLLGIGPGSFWQAEGASEIAQTMLYQRDVHWVQRMVSADGSYIDIFAALGSLGLSLFLLVVVDLYRRLFLYWNQSDSRLIFVLVTFVLLHAVTESTMLYSTNILWLLLLLCYLRVSLVSIVSRKNNL